MSHVSNSALNPYDKYSLTGEEQRSDLPLYECAGCGVGIYEGDTYYDLEDGDYCVECIGNFRRTAYE